MIRRKAYLYVRVSTDEQAEKGYSQKHQDERLRQYCEYNNIDVTGIFWEDYSAKTFNRPEFNKLLNQLKKQRNAADLLLFLKWDRFSRNIAEAYSMINQLNKLGVEPQGIEQPLDLNVPENKIMLAFYLAAPEVENDRRSLNTIAGMRRAMKEGRHVNMAPRGYKNVRDENNNPIIVPSKDANNIKWVFEELSKGNYTVKDVWRLARQKGLKVGRSQMWNLIKNPVYCGRIFIPAYKTEPAEVIPAVHEPIISGELFDEVQDILCGRKRKYPPKQSLKEELPLRGYLLCRKCGNKLSGSASKGNGGRYYYYHCAKGCNERFKATDANFLFLNELSTIAANENAIHALELVIKDYAKMSAEEKSNRQVQTRAEIEKSQQRINNAKQLMLDGQLEPHEYREIKNDYEAQIQKLLGKIQEVNTLNSNLKEKLQFCLQILVNLPNYYVSADLAAKQQIIGSTFPEKLVFENNSYRTTRVNEALCLICRPTKGFSDSKNKKAPDNGGQSNVVPQTGIEPVRPFRVTGF